MELVAVHQALLSTIPASVTHYDTLNFAAWSISVVDFVFDVVTAGTWLGVVTDGGGLGDLCEPITRQGAGPPQPSSLIMTLQSLFW
mgnify:FL=1